MDQNDILTSIKDVETLSTKNKSNANMKRIIKKVAVIGSGIMGSGIACHFANIGVEVLLLDIAPKDLTEAEAKKGLTLENKAVRNRNVNEHLANALKSNPSPIYSEK